MLRVLPVLPVRQVLCLCLVLMVAPAGAAAQPRTLVGEVIDLRCFEKDAANAGDAHVDCALSCARRGAVLGIRNADGVFVIVGDYTAEANKRLIEFVARTVEATGEIAERDGRRTIRLREITLVTRTP